MGDIYSPFIRLEQAKCYHLELTAVVCVCVGVFAGVCPHVFAVKEQKCSLSKQHAVSQQQNLKTVFANII